MLVSRPPFGPGLDPGLSKPSVTPVAGVSEGEGAPFDAACGVAQYRLRQAQGEREGCGCRGQSEDAHSEPARTILDSDTLTPRFHRALAAFRRAEAALAAFRVEEALLPPHRREGAEAERLELRFAVLDGVRIAALRRLLKTPAPDPLALAFKIDLVFDEDVPSLAGGQLCLAAIRADAHRLAHGR